MEPWEMELEFLAHDEYEREIRKANGLTQEDEFEGASDDEMAEYLEQAEQESGEFNPGEEWEEVKDAEQKQ